MTAAHHVPCVLLALVLAHLFASPATAGPEQGGPSSVWSCPTTSTTSPETSAGDRPLLFQKEAVQRAVFDNCFLAGTNAETTTRGDVNIKQVRLGDYFPPPPGHSCEDPRCGEVVRLFPGQTDQVVSITAITRPRAREHRASGSGQESGGEEDGEPPPSSQTIRCTPGHPFFVEGRGFVLAGDLRAGDEFEARGVPVVVASVEVQAERAETFNFEVRCHHTYRVSGAAGQPAVLVHNTSVGSKLRAMRRAMGVAGQPISQTARFATVTVRHVDGMPLNQFNRKVDALIGLGNRGLLSRAASPVARDPMLTRRFKDDLIKRVWAQYGDRNRGLAQSLTERVRRMQPDHVWELQLGGPDVRGNLRMLDAMTNHHIGSRQIWPQIRDLPVGTRIQVRRAP